MRESELPDDVKAFIATFTRGIDGMRDVSIGGSCPGCPTCMERDGYDDENAHREAWSTGDLIGDEGSFSSARCDICKTTLAGDRYVWHWVSGDPNATPPEPRAIEHENDACTDCLMFHANGDLPEQRRAR